MSDRAQVLFDEIAQLTIQYKSEVPGRRRAWPESIKDRIAELRSLGVKYLAISRATGLSIATLYSWKIPSKKTGQFVPMQVVSARIPAAEKNTPTVTVRKSRKLPINQVDALATSTAEVPTVTVVTRTGVRIEGLNSVDVMALLKELVVRGEL